MATIQSSCGLSIETTPNLDEFTKNVVLNKLEGTVSGDGVFDDLMETATKHVIAQFESNRIRNEDYATAYIQIYQETLKVAFQIWAQKGLNDAQIKSTLEDICIKKEQLALEEKQVNADISLKEAELALKEKQVNADIDLKEKQLVLQEKQTDADIALKEAEIALKEKQLTLLEEQIKAEDAKRALYRRQIEGFDEDYKQKILKIMMDAWSVGFSVARDSFEAAGIPAPMQKVAIDGIFNQFIITELNPTRPSTG